MRTRAYVLGASVACIGCGSDPADALQTSISGQSGSITASDDSGGDGTATGDGATGAADDGSDGGPGDGVDDGVDASDGGGDATDAGDASEGGDTGAAGGTVDASDFPSIQAAIDSLEGIGGAVYIPAGEHLIPEKLRVYSNITVFGAGMDQTIIRFEPGVEVDHMLGNDSSGGHENMVIRDLTLQGNGAGGDVSCCHGLELENVVDSFVISVSSRDHGRDGFYFGHKTVDDVLMGVYGTRLSGCHASGNGRNGLSIVQGENNVVDGCTFENNNTTEDVAAIDLEPDPYPDGLVRSNRILQNTVQNNANNGIQMWAAGDAIVANNAICYNTITGNDGTGIADHQSDDDVFVGNELSDNGADADYDGSAKVGDEYEADCGLPLPALPATPPLPP
ncbi:MAG TPA: right-handed parallel beta-helix repeat-containing protein [Nannocystaceae bacterium]|nr:right-handed parallel beta-helix repeat-containing protein [Nannocystaceae bacterium]